MALIVKKFGGTSVGSVEKIQHVARKIIKTADKGNQVVVTVSAMGKTTDELTDLAAKINNQPSQREMDMLLTTGEQISIALLTMALGQEGYSAVSLTGWQAGIRTESMFGNARITNIETDRMKQLLEEGKIVIVAGFQGISAEGEITTLGRGGSDTTAVALAAALKADKCKIHTDVEGIFTCDPRYVSSARKLHSISYDEMLELATLGAGVLHPRAVEFAKNFSVPLEVRSSFTENVGTTVEEEVTVEDHLIVRGLAFEKNVTKVTVSGLPNHINTLSNLFSVLASSGINVDIIIQSVHDQESTNISFSVDTGVLEETLEILSDQKDALAYEEVYYENDLAKVSIVGSGMISNPGVAAKMFDSLAKNDVMIKMVSTSEIKVSAVVAQESLQSSLEALHDTFDLSVKETVTL